MCSLVFCLAMMMVFFPDAFRIISVGGKVRRLVQSAVLGGLLCLWTIPAFAQACAMCYRHGLGNFQRWTKRPSVKLSQSWWLRPLE